MKNLKETTSVVKEYFFHELPVVGNPELLKIIDKVIVCDWDGNAIGLVDSLNSIALNNFEPRDKGAPGIYGCNKYGNVIASVTLYKGEPKSLDPKEQNKHFAVWGVKHTGGY